MRILHVISDLPAFSGPTTALAGLAKAQLALGHNIKVLTAENRKQTTTLEVPTTYLKPGRSSWRWSPETQKALEPLMQECDMLHLHMIWEHLILSAACIANKNGKPFILRPCGMLDQWSLRQSWLKKKIYLSLFGNKLIRNAAAIHFTSQSEYAHVGIKGLGHKAFVSPLGVDRKDFDGLPSTGEFKNRFPISKGIKKIVLFFGRLHYKKQPEVVIQAFQHAFARNNEIGLIMAGPCDAAYKRKLEAMVDKSIRDRVLFTGSLDLEAKKEAYAAATIFVLPSHQENFGLSIVEAMASGCPVVISDKLDLAEEISAAKAGVICPPDIESTAAAMKRVIENDDLRASLAKNGKQLVEAKYTWERAAKGLDGIYQDILTNKRTSPLWVQHEKS